MRLTKEDQVYNLMDTNGRRNDVINAYTIYMEILRDLEVATDSSEFDRYPKSWKQFDFYTEAITRSPEKFTTHPIYDWFVRKLAEPQYREAFESRDIDIIRTLPEGETMLKRLDNGIEDRARHYTSNLVKLGLTYADRRISTVGHSFVEARPIQRGRFENLLPINDTNLIFLRQLLKLRVYNKECTVYYSPMIMCLYILLRLPSISINDLKILVSMINPAHHINPEELVNKFMDTTVEEVESSYIPYNTGTEYREVSNQPVPMDKKYFGTKFKNRKSGKVPEEYYQFYLAYVRFMDSKTADNLKTLYDVWRLSKNKINKAFGFDANVFQFDTRQPTNVSKFLELNKDNEYIQTNTINATIYERFMGSKRHDIVREYSDTFLRLLSVTGIVSLKNGIATLRYRKLWLELSQSVKIEDYVFRKTTKDEYKAYEEVGSSPFFNHISIEKIFDLKDIEVAPIITKINEDLEVTSADEAKVLLKSQINSEFIKYIEENYPKDRVIEILNLFADRSNDQKIQEMVDSTASVPTIFEYIVGIAWYHISNKQYEVFSSFNLTMNADFIPETHAGGGDGDIIARYKDKVVMLEVTLMNKQAQKRGEWEPVLRHAANLTIEEAPKKVFTFFVADELDDNTINIWRAVASVPLKSSREAKEINYAENVTIMPLKNNELSDLLQKDIQEEALIKSTTQSFSQLYSNFDFGWRNKIMSNI